VVVAELGHHGEVVADCGVVAVLAVPDGEHVALPRRERLAGGGKATADCCGGKTTNGPCWRPVIVTCAIVGGRR
jgi:hypothetical protein